MKVAEQSRDSRRRSHEGWPTVKQLFFDVSSRRADFEKKPLKCHRRSSEVLRPSADCQTLFCILTFQQKWQTVEKSRRTVTIRDIMVIKTMNFPFSTSQGERIHQAAQTIVRLT